MKAILRVTVLSLFFSSVTGACMSPLSLNPFKKEVYLMSPLKGQLVKDGQPLANVELEVSLSMPGEERTFKHQTDENGYFDLPAITEKMHLGPMTEFAIGQYVFAYVDGEKIRFWYAGKREPGKYAEFTPPGEAEDLICNIGDENQFTDQGAGFIGTICKWKSIRR